MISLILAYIDPTGGLPPSSWGMLLTALLATLGMGLTALKLFGQRLLSRLAAIGRRSWVAYRSE